MGGLIRELAYPRVGNQTVSVNNANKNNKKRN